MNLFGPLFRNKRFVLNKIFQQNDSKFAIFYVCGIFRFSFRLTDNQKLQFFLQEMSRKNGNPVCVSNKSFLKTIPTITI